MLKKLIVTLFLIILMLIVPRVIEAATVHGTAYDFSLEQLKDVIIEINTSPTQRILSKGGTYSFEAPPGIYLITVKTLENTTLTQEQVEIKKDGIYVIDLLVFPDMNEEELLEDTNLNLELPTEEKSRMIPIIITATITILIILVILILKSRKFLNMKSKQQKMQAEKDQNKSQDENVTKVIDIIKQEEGRTTQLEIRKRLGLSEAKISLIIAELEHKGIIQKIKKGRGNIIILK